MDIVTSVDKATTAADLRNAAMVMDHVGKTEEQYVDAHSGSVCLEGALMLATDMQLVTTNNGRSFYGPLGWLIPASENYSLRRAAAMSVLAPLMPEHCVCGEQNPVADEYRVYHYSDHACDGKGQAIAALVEAAEKLEADL